MWYIKLLGPAVLCRMWCTSDRIMPPLRCLDAFVISVLHQLRCAVRAIRTGIKTASKAAQTDIGLDYIWGSAVYAGSAVHNRWACIRYFETRSGTEHFLAYKVDCGRWGGSDYRFASDVQTLK
jgi:hypothetical protein